MTDRHAVFSRSLSGLVPANEAAMESLRGVKVDERLAVKVSRPRNIRAHNKYWAICSHIAEATGNTAEGVSDVIKVLTGHVVYTKTLQGIEESPASISWAKMDEAAFGPFLDRVCDVIRTRWLPNMSNAELRAELAEMVA